MLLHLTNNLKSEFAFIETVHGGYLNSLTFSNVGELSWSWIPKKFPGSRREREMRRRFPTFSIIVKLGNSRHSCTVTEKKCTKKCAARAKLLLLPPFYQIL